MILHDVLRDLRAYADSRPGDRIARIVGDLDAALAGGGEPVGYIAQSSIDALNACRNDEHNGYANIWMRPRDSETIPLFTHPAGAVQVTYEVVERVAWAIMPKMGDTREIEIATAKGDGRWTQAVETAKAAIEALNHGGSRE